MKIYRIITPTRDVDLYVPVWLALFFKKFVKIKSVPHETNLSGASLDVIICDEEEDVRARGGSK